MPYDGVNYPLWYALQHISTFVGLTTVVVFLMLKESGPAQTQGRISYWIIVTAITFITVAIRFWLKSSDYNLGNLVVCTISGLCIGLILCGLIPFWKETGTNQHT